MSNKFFNDFERIEVRTGENDPSYLGRSGFQAVLSKLPKRGAGSSKECTPGYVKRQADLPRCGLRTLILGGPVCQSTKPDLHRLQGGAARR
jgi:hypothetical protein